MIKHILDWFRPEDVFSIIGLTLILMFIGEQLARNDLAIRSKACWFSAIAFLAYAGIAVNARGIATAASAVEIAIRALLARGVAYGGGLIMFAIVSAVERRVRAWECFDKPSEPYEPPMPDPKPAEPPRTPEPVPPPPLPAEQRAEGAWNRYQRRLQLIENAGLDTLEASAAKAKAKLTYLKDIDEVLS